MDRKTELKELIVSASQSYYETGEVVVDDATFDAWLEEYTILAPDDPILKEVGFGYDFNGIDEKEKFEHPIEVGSITKEKSIEAALRWVKPGYTVTTKLDGNSVVLYYKNGKLWKAVTRGRKNVGIDRTAKFMQCPGIAKEIPSKAYVAIRGETVIKKSDYTVENGFDVSKSSRNAVAGAISRKDNWENVFKFVDFVAYTFVNVDEHRDIYRDYNWDDYFTVEHQKTESIEFLRDIPSFKKKYKDDPIYEADGSVFKNPDGSMLAFKFEDEKKLTKQNKIEIQIGVDQRLTPVSNFDPVNLAGATITKASLGSMGNAIKIGCWPVHSNHVIEITRANEVIPHVERTVSSSNDVKFYAPVCPVCGSEGEPNGEHYFCVNPECENLNSSKLYKFSGFFYPEGISNKVMKKIFDHLNVSTVFELLEVDETQYMNINVPGVGDSTKAKIVQFFENIHQPVDSKIVYQTFLKSCGKTFSKVVVDHGIKFDEYINDSANLNSLFTIPGFHREIVFEMNRNRHIFKRLASLLTIVDEVKAVTKGTFCITGARFSGLQLQAVLDAGWGEDSSLKKTTTVLITKDVDSNSGKTKKAREYGVTIVTVEEFLMDWIGQ